MGTELNPIGDGPLPATIPCVECLGTCRFLTGTWAPDEAPVPGDVATYRCPECGERFDVVVEADEDGEPIV